MWNISEQTIIFDEVMSNQLGKKQCGPNEIVYVPNSRVYEQLTNGGKSRVWSERVVFVEYPKALHGPDMQSVTVYNKNEEEAALANGWTLKPQIEEKPEEFAPSPFRAPKFAIEPPNSGNAMNPEPRRGPGRPRVNA